MRPWPIALCVVSPLIAAACGGPCPARSRAATQLARPATPEVPVATPSEATSPAPPEGAALTAPSAAPGNPTPSDATPGGTASSGAAPSGASSSSATPGAGTAPFASASSTPAAQPALVDDAGRPLPQTDVHPSPDGPSLALRAAALVRAIAEDAPADAAEAFFPVLAYEAVKDIPRPARDWKLRLFAAFERDIHAQHRALGADAAGLSLVRLEIPDARARWMKPGSEGNKLGYWRVLRAQLVVRTASGEERKISITSLISWRGEWYVVHLAGFK